jgi:hypothetical protein
VALRVRRVEEDGEYLFHLENGNRYRREDLTFYAGSAHRAHLVKLR